MWYRPLVAPAVWYLCSGAVVRPLCCVGFRTKPLCANQVGMLPLAMPPAPAPVWAGGCPAPVVVQAPSPQRGVCGAPGEGHALFLMLVDGAAVLLYAMPPSAPEEAPTPPAAHCCSVVPEPTSCVVLSFERHSARGTKGVFAEKIQGQVCVSWFAAQPALNTGNRAGCSASCTPCHGSTLPGVWVCGAGSPWAGWPQVAGTKNRLAAPPATGGGRHVHHAGRQPAVLVLPVCVVCVLTGTAVPTTCVSAGGRVLGVHLGAPQAPLLRHAGHRVPTHPPWPSGRGCDTHSICALYQQQI